MRREIDRTGGLFTKDVAQNRLRQRLVAGLILVFLVVLAFAPAAFAYGYRSGSSSCPYGKQVRIVSRTTMNYKHYWESGLAEDWFGDSSPHWAYTKTWEQSTDWTVTTDGALYNAYTDCVYMPV
ncbi:MAG: hypothetical protein KatS3mg011_0713 [Acidimicrobiia bacterium]|nr:MAG: hypothetical protein KatS3mg011_0713 [Acidimicrobiia bacterium]